MSPHKTLLAFAALVAGAAAVGCGDGEIGSAPVVKVSPEERARDLNSSAESTVKWLEGMPATDRQAALQRSPQVAASLKEASDPALKQRIAALGVKLP